MCCPWGLRIEFKKIIGIALVVVDLLFPNVQSRPSLVRGRREGAEDAFLCRPLNSLLHHLLQCEISGTARRRRERERGNIILPFRRSRRKGELFKGRSRVTPRQFPEIGAARCDGLDGWRKFKLRSGGARK